MQLIIFSVYVCCLNVALAAMLGSNNEDMAEMFNNGDQLETNHRMKRSTSSCTSTTNCVAECAGCSITCLQCKANCILDTKSITVYTVTNDVPFISQSGNSAPVGLDVDLMANISAITGLKFTYKYYIFAELISKVQNNAQSLSISTETDTIVREQNVSFAQFFQSGTTFLVRLCYDTAINGLSDLCGETVGVLTGSIQEASLKTQNEQCGANNKITLKSYTTTPAVIQALKNGEVDVCLGDQASFAVAVSQASNVLKIVGNTYDVAPYGILCNKNNTDLCCEIVAAINYLIKKGIYKQILEKYSFTYEANGVCPSQLNLQGLTCPTTCQPSTSFCNSQISP